MRICVVPSNRPEQLASWLKAWRPVADWDKLIVIFDGPACDAPQIDDVEVWNWDTIRDALGDKAWIISRRDSAIRCFGFWRAWDIGADFIGTLDDDCFPLADNWFSAHVESMQLPRWESSVPGLRVRGLPYDLSETYNSVLNMGLWSGHADLDAVSRLSAPQNDFCPPTNRVALPIGQYRPLCGMNLVFESDFAPALYFPLMGEGQPYRRFDDIWAGCIAKKLADRLGRCWTIGSPLIDHRQASNQFAALQAEAPGIAAHEQFWRWIDRATIREAATPSAAMRELARSLKQTLNDHDREYRERITAAMDVWAGLFQDS